MWPMNMCSSLQHCFRVLAALDRASRLTLSLLLGLVVQGTKRLVSMAAPGVGRGGPQPLSVGDALLYLDQVRESWHHGGPSMLCVTVYSHIRYSGRICRRGGVHSYFACI